MTKPEKKRVYVGLAIVIVILFCGGIFVGYAQRNDKLCPDGKPAVSQEGDASIGQTLYLCHDGVVVTKGS